MVMMVRDDDGNDDGVLSFILFIGFGQLKGKAGDKYHKTWAMYFAKFIKAYEDSGIKIWGVTVQNEPSDGFLPGLVIID